MFDEELQRLVSSVPGAMAASLTGLDGIAVASTNPGNVPLEHIAAELTSAYRSVQVTNTGMDIGSLAQLMLLTEKYAMYLSSVTSEYYVLVVMSPDGSHGKARFEMKKIRHSLADELV